MRFPRRDRDGLHVSVSVEIFGNTELESEDRGLPWARHTAESARAQITGNALKWTAVTLVSTGYLLVTGGYWIVFRGLCRICWP